MEETEDDRELRPSADFRGLPDPPFCFGGLPRRFGTFTGAALCNANSLKPGGTESKPGGA